MFYFHHKERYWKVAIILKWLENDGLDVNNRTPSFLDCY
jgi:hypothetical protein